MNHIDLHNRRAVVTGGGQGIGRAIAERLLVSGATVRLWDKDGALVRDTARQIDGDGRASATEVDVTDPQSVHSATAATLDALGGIDVLVNNAGIAGLNAKLWEYPIEEWRRVLTTDLDSVFLCCRAIVPHMLEAGYGRIVNVASIAGKDGNPNASAYSAAKAGVIALTKSLGKELAETGVLVNCITPAAARTRIFDQMSQAHIDYMLSKIPMGRFVRTEEIAALVAWLCSEECAFSTGAVFDISGGRASY